ncbi:hypothetical protein [Streptomyces sp. VRA16 Mangrove soil]|uniref:hypothetical protein n=1 Tax=Streptomyces sp. VRA16 Mangrove soil TaxID=2817434 RepID=UPI001A9CE539|nr:hypothetical protein [Streptomyces sp. VRA16 Mangrove soil]MBO1332455.1 hypothetical protein [Streptomyces sp. VRA16 Mangrove soil]
MLDAVSSEVVVVESDKAGVSSPWEGLSLGLSVGFSVGGGVVAVFALVVATVTGSPGVALKSFEGL